LPVPFPLFGLSPAQESEDREAAMARNRHQDADENARFFFVLTTSSFIPS
jgi:hypothetical protein